MFKLEPVYILTNRYYYCSSKHLQASPFFTNMSETNKMSHPVFENPFSVTFLLIYKGNRFMWNRNLKNTCVQGRNKARKRSTVFCWLLSIISSTQCNKSKSSHPYFICERLSFHFPHLYGSNRSWMSLKDCNWCTSSKTPHSYNLVTAACGNKSVLIVNSHVRNFSRVPSKCSEEASIICCPNFHQTVIWTLL